VLLSCSPLLIAIQFFADDCLDERAESRRVNAHLNAALTHANSAVDNFWADRSKVQALSLLQDRISQTGVLAETFRSALAMVHKVMFPLNNQPDGLPAFWSGSRMGKLSTILFDATSTMALGFLYLLFGSTTRTLIWSW
jgi:hypothetical protein